MWKPEIRPSLVPTGVRNVSGQRAPYDRAILRRCSRYTSLQPDEPDFGVGDLISLATLWGAALNGHRRFDEAYLGAAYRAVCAGLGMDPDNELTQTLGIHPPTRRGAGDRLAETYRHAGIHRFLWIRATILGLQDPWGNALEGDIWGVRVFPRDSPEYGRIRGAVDWYHENVDLYPAGIVKLDAALCSLFRWDPELRVTFAELRQTHGLPEWEDEF